MEYLDINALIQSIGIPATFGLLFMLYTNANRKDASDRDKNASKMMLKQLEVLDKQTDVLGAIKDNVDALSIQNGNNTRLMETVNAGISAIRIELTNTNGKIESNHQIHLSHFLGILDKLTPLYQIIADAKDAWQSEQTRTQNENKKTIEMMVQLQTDVTAMQADVINLIETVIREDKKHEEISIPSVNLAFSSDGD